MGIPSVIIRYGNAIAMDNFDILFTIGGLICSSYTGFSKSEIAYCTSKRNWYPLQNFLMSNDPYAALIELDLNPVMNIVGYYQLLVGCMIQFPNEETNPRMANLLKIIDNENAFDKILSNSKLLKALLAINARFNHQNENDTFCVFLNCKRILAHFFTKFPDMLKLNVLRTKKTKRLKFTTDDLKFFNYKN